MRNNTVGSLIAPINLSVHAIIYSVVFSVHYSNGYTWEAEMIEETPKGRGNIEIKIKFKHAQGESEF